MTKEYLKSEISKAENATPTYYMLEKASNIMKYLAIALLVLGCISAIISWKSIGFAAFLTVLISTLTSSGLFYALSAIIAGIAAISHFTSNTNKLLKLQIKANNDISDEK